LIDTQLNLDNFKLWQQNDPSTQQIKTNLKEYEPTHNIHKIWTEQDGLLYINNEYLQQQGQRRKKKLRQFSIRRKHSLYVPNTIVKGIPVRYAVMRWAHGLPCTGHLGVTGTYRIIRQSFFWKGMIDDIKRWIKHCHPCQRRKNSKKNRQGLHKSVLQTRPFETVSIDLVGKFPTADGNKYILTIIDHFTRYPIAVPIPSKKAPVVAQALKTHLFCAFPYWPRKIVSDKGGEFVNKALKHIYEQLGIKQVLTSHDNPKANQVERFHRYLSTAIAVFIRDKCREVLWPQYLDTAVYIYRCSVNNSTGYSPFYALYGVHPQNPLEIILNMDDQKFDDQQEHTRTILKSFRDAYVDIHTNQLNMALHNAKKNANRQDVTFHPGQMVWVWRKHSPQKLENRFDGPYKVQGKINDNSYIVEIGVDENEQPITKKVSITHLHPYDPNDDTIFDTSPQYIYDNNETELWKSPTHHQEDTFAIIPSYAWAEVEAFKLPWMLGKIVNSTRTRLQLQLFCNKKRDLVGQQHPGFVDIGTSTHTSRSYFEKSIRSGPNHILYTNYMNHKHYKYEYNIDPTHIHIHGFQLTNENTIPDTVLRVIDRDRWIDWKLV
jgi:hypothetical protein